MRERNTSCWRESSGERGGVRERVAEEPDPIEGAGGADPGWVPQGQGGDFIVDQGGVDAAEPDGLLQRLVGVELPQSAANLGIGEEVGDTEPTLTSAEVDHEVADERPVCPRRGRTGR
jgi:hypothetical protein